MNRTCITKILFHNKNIEMPKHMKTLKIELFEKKYVIRIGQYGPPQEANKNLELSKQLAQSIWCLDLEGNILWKNKPYFDITNIPDSELTWMNFLPLMDFKIDKEKNILIAYGINMAEIHIEIDTGKTIKKTLGYKN